MADLKNAPKSGNWTGRSTQSGRFVEVKPSPGRSGAVLREILGPDGKVRRRLDPDVVEQAIRDSGRKK
jgi:hypothetical protein